jgi:hypothetical protein
MNPNQSQINVIKARIDQIKNSELFSETEKPRLLKQLEKELEQLSPNTTPS